MADKVMGEEAAVKLVQKIDETYARRKVYAADSCAKAQSLKNTAGIQGGGYGKWLFYKYTSKYNKAGDFSSLQLVYDRDILLSMIPDTVELVDDLPTSAWSTTDCYHGYYRTYVYCKSNGSWSTNFYTDDPGQLWINGEKIIEHTICTTTNITINFKAGWNCVECTFSENRSAEGAGFNPQLTSSGYVINAYPTEDKVNIDDSLYWADQQLTKIATTDKTPTFKSITLKNTSGDVSLYATTSSLANNSILSVYDEGSAYGQKIVLCGNGTTLIGAGESAKSYYSSVTNENLYLMADSNIYLHSNCDTIGNRKTIYMDTSGNLNFNATGSVKNLAVGGGIYWNSYVESSTDESDAASITVIKSGVAGGTELRIKQENDAGDVINLCAPYYIYLNSKRAFGIFDGWLRINESKGFNSGVYFGDNIVRTDGSLQVGESGSYNLLNSNGIYSAGFHHKSQDNNNYVLLAGGGYKALSEFAIGNATKLLYSGMDNNCFTVAQTSDNFKGKKGWATYLIGNHGNGDTYYNQIIRLPFYSAPEYGRAVNNGVTSWHNFITDENIGNQNVNYATSAGSADNADKLDGFHASDFLRGTYYWADQIISSSKSTTTSPTLGSLKIGSNGEYNLLNSSGVYSVGFHHKTVNSDNYVLLAGGGYKNLADLMNGSYTTTVTVNGDANTYYPVYVQPTSDKTKPHYLSIWKNLGSTTAQYPNNHPDGTSSLWLIYEHRNTGWDGNGGYCKTWYKSEPYAQLVAHAQPGTSAANGMIVWLRGGGTSYNISADWNISLEGMVTVYLDTADIGFPPNYPYKISPRTASTSDNNNGIYKSLLGYGDIDGNANYAGRAGNADTLDGRHDYGFMYVRKSNHYNDTKSLDNYADGRFSCGMTNAGGPWGSKWTHFINLGWNNGSTGTWNTQIAACPEDSSQPLKWRTNGASGQWRDIIDSTNIGNYYWADQKISSSKSTTTVPTLGGLQVINDSSNTTKVLAYFRHKSSANWAMTLDKENTYDYGLKISTAQSASHGLQVGGQLIVDSQCGSYREGIRLKAADGQWSTIILGATGDSGTNTNAWSIHRKDDNNFAISRNSSDGKNGLVISSSGNVGIGYTSPKYRLHVHGSGHFIKQVKLLGDESTSNITGIIMNASDDTQRAYCGFLGNVNNADYGDTGLRIGTNYGSIRLEPVANIEITKSILPCYYYYPENGGDTRETNLGSTSHEFANVYSRNVRCRHIDGDAVFSNKDLYVGYNTDIINLGRNGHSYVSHAVWSLGKPVIINGGTDELDTIKPHAANFGYVGRENQQFWKMYSTYYYYRNAPTSFSDIRFKTDIKTINSNKKYLDIINSIPVITFNYTDTEELKEKNNKHLKKLIKEYDYLKSIETPTQEQIKRKKELRSEICSPSKFKNSRMIGTSAQELEKVLPPEIRNMIVRREKTKRCNDERYVNEVKLIYPIILALKEQKQINEQLQNTVNSLSERLAKLEELLNGNNMK